MKVFGPVPSRRLGNSLGINNIPHKVCSYSCLYCQVGKAGKLQVERQEFYKPEDIVSEVNALLCNITENIQYPDYISIVPDGEPTLDIHLGELIDKLKVFKIPVAVITNASLIDRPDVQDELRKADYVSVKADSFCINTWKKINIPHKQLQLNDISCGISSFLRNFEGTFVTETMLLKGINDSYDDIETTAKFIGSYEPSIAYLSVPTRPTAFKNIKPADESTILEAYKVFSEYVDKVELLTGYEGNSFSTSGNSKKDLLSITAVHPMREDAVFELLNKNGDSEQLLDALLKEELIKVSYNNANYYVRRFKRKGNL
jgi:wyosine [tRNA(Phe)-imidazoG37] synthetase (radical SAM superfamily)